MNSLAASIQGRFDFHFLPIQLPTALVQALLPPNWSSIQHTPTTAPPTKADHSWVVIQSGKQIATGPSMPGGKNTFLEAKLEIPFLRHPSCSPESTTLVGFKQTIIFSSLMMTLASKAYPGLRTTKTTFTGETAPGAKYEAVGWIVVEPVEGEVVGDGWAESLVREEVASWWAGSATGGTAFKHNMTPLTPPTQHRLKLRLHLPSFAQLDDEEVGALAPELSLDADGWYEVVVDGWWLSEQTQMQATSASKLE